MARASTKTRAQILFAAAKLFLEKGYTKTRLRDIAEALDATVGIITNQFESKEDILCELVQFVVENQFAATEKIISPYTDDKILFYAAETSLQLHITEINENLRDLYCSAYSLAKTSQILQKTVTRKLEQVFKEHLPHLKTQDFYKLEIATGGIMRGFMTIPCDMWFTMDQKIESFLEATFLIYRVPDEKIKEAIAFVSQFDYTDIAGKTIDSYIQYLERKQDEVL